MTKTTPTTFFGLFNDGWQSKDDDGHTGYGGTPEAAQEALEEAQDKDVDTASQNLLWWNHGKPVERDDD